MSAARAGPAPLQELLEAVAALDQAAAPADPAILAELTRVGARLGTLVAPRSLPPGREHPAARHLARALASTRGEVAPLAAALGRMAGYLPWRYGYPRRENAPELADRIAFAELVGPGAPLEADVLCLGVTLIAPRTRYPPHHHPAIELYRVLSGTARWSADGVARAVPPGALVLHASGVVHAMATHDEPLLAVYTWTGEDVRTPSAYT